MYKNFIDELSIVSQKKQILERLLDKLAKLHLIPILGVEIEFYLLKDFDINKLSEATGYNIKDEKGKLQYEIELNPDQNILNIIDKIHSAKKILATATNHYISFDPKPYPEDYGSSMHFHVNFLDNNNQNYFNNDESLHKAAAFLCNDVLRTLLIFVNVEQDLSRLNHEYMAPTHICFGGNNRTVAVRIPSASVKRLEYRLAHPMNCPYLSIYAILKSIYSGMIANTETSSDITSRFKKIHGNAFDSQYKLERIPDNLQTIFKNFDIKFFN